MFSMPLDRHFASLRAMYDIIDDYIGTGMYKYDFDEDETYTAKDVLGACYNFVLSDLKEIGLYVNTNEDELLQDIFTCGYIYLVAKFIRRDNFISLLKSTNITAKVASLLEASSTDKYLFNSLVKLVLEATQTRNLELTELPYISEMIYNDDHFVAYLKDVLAEAEENTDDTETVIPEQDLPAVTKYLAKINAGRVRVKLIALAVADKLVDYGVNLTKLNKLIKDYDYDKIAPEAISTYAKVDNEDEPANEELAEFKKEQLDAHHLRSPHHIEHWLAGIDTDFTIDDLIMLVCHHAEPGVNADDFVSKVKEMVDKSGSFFDENQLRMVNAITKFVADFIRNEKE